MFATVFTALAVVLGSAVVGQAVFALSGRQRLSSLSPAVGLAILITVAWWAVHLPGRGTAAILVLAALVAASAWLVWRRRVWAPDRAMGLWIATMVGAASLLLALSPFLVEMRFGILGTSLNPDMSQHLFAASQLASGGTERLIDSGYPLGPHALVVAFESIGVGLVQGFGGLTVAIAVIACLTPLTALRGIGPRRQLVGALLIGLSYLFVAGLVQGSFKEMLEALFVLATAIAAWQVGRNLLLGPTGKSIALGIPFALLATGVVYSYSWPGLLWIIGGLVIWAGVEKSILFVRAGKGEDGLQAMRDWFRPWWPTLGVAAGVFLVTILPEIPRMIDFARFETFAPAGAGLGNLFDSLSPFLALGVWPSGDFRVEPGDGTVPAFFFLIGVALSLWILFNGVRAEMREREYALISFLGVAFLLWLYAEVAGTPYQAAKALLIASPLVMFISVTGFMSLRPGAGEWWRQLLRIPVAVCFIAAATVSSLLVLGNGPVGPSKWTPLLNEIRPLDGPALVVADSDFMDDDRGRALVTWELRGGYVCTDVLSDSGDMPEIPEGIVYLVRVEDGRVSVTYTKPDEGAPADAGCPFIPDGPNTEPPSG